MVGLMLTGRPLSEVRELTLEQLAILAELRGFGRRRKR
jgi:hypothetical protein